MSRQHICTSAYGTKGGRPGAPTYSPEIIAIFICLKTCVFNTAEYSCTPYCSLRTVVGLPGSSADGRHLQLHAYTDTDNNNFHLMLIYVSICDIFRAVPSGETTVGRNEDQDITVADPSVSGAHAVIEVLEVPGGGGKRLTLKVIHASQGSG